MSVQLREVLVPAIAGLRVLAPLTGTNIDDKVLEGLVALEQSPPLLDFFQKELDRILTSDMPEGALAMTIRPDDPEFIAAIKASPEALIFARKKDPSLPEKAEELNLDQIIQIGKLFAQYAPVLIAIWKAWKSASTQ